MPSPAGGEGTSTIAAALGYPAERKIVTGRLRPRAPFLRRRTSRAGVGPGAHDLAEARLRPGRRRASSSWRPRPSHERILAEVMQQRRHVAIAVAGAVLDLLADLSERAALPGHRKRGEMPFRMAGHMGRIEVCRSMAGVARKRRSAVAVGAAHDQRLMRVPLIGLPRSVASGMTVHAAR